MSERLPSTRPLTDQEIAIEFDLQDGEYAEGITAVEEFHELRQSLFLSVQTVMRGEGQSLEESAAEIVNLLSATAATYAYIFEDEKMFEDKVCYAAASLHAAVEHLKAFIDGFDVPVSVVPRTTEEYEEEIRKRFNAVRPERDYEILEGMFGAIHRYHLNELLQHARS